MAPSKRTLKSGRPPTARLKTTSLSKKHTSKTIRSYHQLNKALAAAEKAHDDDLADDLRSQIARLGGLDFYQKASIQGQAVDRGGDSSVVLMDWLGDLNLSTGGGGERRLRLLEVGALSIKNACSKCGVFDITRIDLNSQSEGILKQDFMERPLPISATEKFDMISLSLVLNFVPSPIGRGEMLRRTRAFLANQSAADNEVRGEDLVFPCLFLVLPAACTTNSRFLNDELLCQIMASLGYALRQRKQTAKLVYYLWVLRDQGEERALFGKREVNPGLRRNNFCVVLEGQEGDG